MKKATLLLLLATFVVTAGGHIHAIGSPSWGTGPKVGWSCLVEIKDSGAVVYGQSRTSWGAKLTVRKLGPRAVRRTDK